MTLDEGYIKYRSLWTSTEPPDSAAAAQLERWRAPLFAAGLIGHYEEHNVGYGNTSVRSGNPGQFLISGTQTGHLVTTSAQHYALVCAYDIDENWVECRGPIQASSESMTHAAIYELSPDIGAIVHVHSRALWQHHKHQLPTTDVNVAYGTPQMAREFRRLYFDGDFRDCGLAVMAGHDEGMVSIGATLAEAAERILQCDSVNRP